MMKLVVFDFDGVLFDGFKQVWKILRRIFKKHGFTKVLTADDFKKLFLKNFYVSTEELGFDIINTPGLKEEIIEQVNKEFDPPLFNGMEDVVKSLSDKAVLAIESSNFEPVMRRMLRKEGLEKNFTHVVGADKIASKTERLKMLTEKIHPEKVVFVTDTVGDIEEAKTIGIPVIAVTWGYHNYRQLKKAQPLCIVRKPEELVEQVERVLYG